MYYKDINRIRSKLLSLEVSHIIPDDASYIDLTEIEEEKFSLPGNIYYEPFYLRYVLTYTIPKDVQVTVEFRRLHS